MCVAVVLGACRPPGTDEPAETASAGAQAPCVVRRAAYDIGSATTKVKVAEIDRCAGRTLKILLSDDAPVFYRDEVSGTLPAFSPQTMDRGVAVLRDFAERAAAFHPVESAAVATSAFRRADNASKMIQRIRAELGIPVSIISQAQEARIGFIGAVLTAAIEPQHAVVWDVGGRSMQLTTLQDNGRLFIFEGKLASGQMRDFLIRDVKGLPATVRSPNPVSEAEVDKARTFAEAYANEHVPAWLRQKLTAPETVVVGIGALKYYGDRPASEPGASCSRGGLMLTVSALLGKTDEEIGGSYASTAISDRLLIAAFMEALQIESVRLAEVDLTDGLLFESEYWPSRRTVQGWSFWRDRWGTRVASSPSFALGPSSVPHMVLQR